MSTARTAPTAPVRHERTGPVALVTVDRPAYRNARNTGNTQNARTAAMTYALAEARRRAAGDDRVKVAVRAGGGAACGPHHPAHAHNAESAADALGGMGIRVTKAAGS